MHPREVERALDRLLPAVHWLAVFLLLVCALVVAQGRWHWALLGVLALQPTAVWLAVRARRESRPGLAGLAFGLTLGTFGLATLLFSLT